MAKTNGLDPCFIANSCPTNFSSTGILVRIIRELGLVISRERVTDRGVLDPLGAAGGCLVH